MNVFTFQYETNCGDTLVSVFDSLDAVITRLKMMQLHDSFDEYETIHISCQEVTDNDEMEKRLNNVKTAIANRSRN